MRPVSNSQDNDHHIKQIQQTNEVFSEEGTVVSVYQEPHIVMTNSDNYQSNNQEKDRIIDDLKH